MSQSPEIGQMVFGNPTGDYGTNEYTDALVEYLLREISRVFWNKNQRKWDRAEDPQLVGVIYNRYYWGHDEVEEAKPNLAFNHSPQEIRWYKYPGRGQSCTLEWNEKEWRTWFDEALEIIRKNDKHI